MSCLACIAHFDGHPASVQAVKAVLDATSHLAPDGSGFHLDGFVVLGQGMRHTTPESLHEKQPLANEAGTVWLVMDGRVDNREELQGALKARGCLLRDDTDAELVLRAYETWGEDSPQHIVGELAWLVWDATKQRIFASRDVAGVRGFYYAHDPHTGRFALASQVRGLLALPDQPRKLNHSRWLDLWTIEFDRNDEVGTVYEGISRLPAGHAMRVDASGLKVWRYWDPRSLTENKFASLDECAEAFRDTLRSVVAPRMRRTGPVGAALSGGLDSSTIVGMVSRDFGNMLDQPLRTYSLAGNRFEDCLDWQCVDAMTKADPMLAPRIFQPPSVDRYLDGYDALIAQNDDPGSAAAGWAYHAIGEAIREDKCGLVFEGMAGDFLFHAGPASVRKLMESGQWARLPEYIRTMSRFGWPAWQAARNVAVSSLASCLPDAVLQRLRDGRDEQSLSQGELSFLRADQARPMVARHRAQVRRNVEELRGMGDLVQHAALYMSGMLSFSHESGQASVRLPGAEGRSPFSDRRMIEFGIRMPLEAKICNPYYKPLLRKVAEPYLPKEVAWRKMVGYHPGWLFHQRMNEHLVRKMNRETFLRQCVEPLSPWIRVDKMMQAWDALAAGHPVHRGGWPVYYACVASTWLKAKGL
jgi:asparagine synthase (glutamine-hydrolysing)